MFRHASIDRALLLRFAAEGLTKSASMLTMPLLIRLLGVQEYGQFTFTQASIAVGVPLLSLGLGFSLIRQIAGSGDQTIIVERLGSAFALVSALALPVATLLWIAAPAFSVLLPPGIGYAGIIRMSALLLVTTCWYNLATEALRARLKTTAATGLQIAEAVSFPAAIGLLAYTDMISVPIIIGVLSGLKLTIAVTAFLIAVRGSRPLHSLSWLSSSGELRSALSIGLPFMVASLGEWLMGLGDRFVIGMVSGSEAVGRYSASQVTVGVLASWGAPFWWILFPRLCRALEESGRPAAIRAAQAIGGLFLEFGIPLLALIMLCGKDILSLLGGHGLRVGTLVLSMLAAASFVNQAATPWEYALYAGRSGSLLMRATLLWGGVAFVLTLLLTQSHGLAGAAFAALLGRLGFTITTVIYARRIGFDGWLIAAPQRLVRIGIAAVAASSSAGVALSAGLAPVGAYAIFALIYAATAFSVRRLQPSAP